MIIPNSRIDRFAERAELSVGTASSTMRLSDTRSNRVLRRFSIKDAAEFIGMGRQFLYTWLEHEDAPEGILQGRERTLSVDDIMLLRALSSSRKKGRRPTLFWRKPGDRLPVIAVGSQKGGSAKTVTAANLALYAHLFYGLRVGVIDADPQSSVSLYFADNKIDIAGAETETFSAFMGVGAPNGPVLEHTPEALDAFWRRTPWPGLRLMPGGVPIQEADIALYFLSRKTGPEGRRIFRLFRDALARWEVAHPPRTDPADLYDKKGRFLRDAYEAALYETLDLIIIDTAPALTLAQLNAIVAADTLIIPQTMKGFDLSTLRIYLASLAEYLRFIRTTDAPIEFAELPSYILPTIISTTSDTDLRQIGELYAADPEVICPVFYARSDAVANAAEDYQSIYEYQPPKGRRASADSFIANANAVGDAILSRAIPGLPSRGFANEFIARNLPSSTAPWTEKAA